MTDQPRFDMGRAYQALDIDYIIYPREQRRTMLLTHLEQCIEPAPDPVPTVPHGLHLGLVGWLLAASIISLFLAPQAWPLDVASILLGGYALYRYLRTTTPHRKEHP